MVFTDTQKVVDLHKEIEDKNTQLQVLVNSLASENQNMKDKISSMEDRMERLGKVESENAEIKNKMKALETTLTEVINKITEMSSNEN